MEEQITIYSDLLDFWEKNRDSIRKILVGKNGFNKRINLSSIFIDRGNRNICSSRFNFTKNNYNRCKSCSEFCLLSSTGTPENEEIQIENSIIRTQKNSLFVGEIFFVRKEFSYNSLYKKLDKSYLSLQFTNGSIKNTALCICLEFLKINTGLLASYFCDNHVVVNKKPYNKLTKISSYEFEELIFNFIRISEKIIHGNECLDSVEFYVENREIITYINPCEKTTLCISGYSGETVIILSEDYQENYNSSFPLDVIISTNEQDLDIDFPTIEKYRKMINLTIRPTEQLFEYYEKKCFNVFPGFNFYIWMIVLMSKREYYNCFSESMLNLIFYQEDILNIKSEITNLHMISCKRQDIKNFCIKTNFAMKLDIIEIMKTYFTKQMGE